MTQCEAADYRRGHSAETACVFPKQAASVH